jgi:hypothetical protein
MLPQIVELLFYGLLSIAIAVMTVDLVSHVDRWTR